MSFTFTTTGLFAMPHLRFRWLWLAIGFGMIGFIVFVSVIRLPPPIQGWMSHDKLLHLCAYAGLMGWFAQLFRNDLTRLLLVIAFIALGVGVEFLQGMTPIRSFDVVDMVANTSGVVLAWALAYTWVGSILMRFESLFGVQRADV